MDIYAIIMHIISYISHYTNQAWTSLKLPKVLTYKEVVISMGTGRST